MKLQGMKQIADYAGVSDVTVLDWTRSRGFPATKVAGEWVATTEDVDAWNLDQQVTNSPAGRAITALVARTDAAIAALTRRVVELEQSTQTTRGKRGR